MTTTHPNLLKFLLTERHLQNYRTFCREYDKQAAVIDQSLVGTYPSRAQFYRWISGEISGLPYPDHCRVLEAILSGNTAKELFSNHRRNGPDEPSAEPRADSTSETIAAARAVGLRPHIERAFDQPKVSVDFAGFSGETLHGAIQEPIDKIRVGRLRPEEIAIRILVPDLSVPVGLPALASTRQDAPAVRGRSDQITRRYNQAILESVHELADFGRVNAASAQVRVYRTSPLFKLYILNSEEVFFGFYPVLEHTVMVEGEQTGIFDAMGKDAILFHYEASDDDSSIGAQHVQQAQMWFNSVWNTIATDFTP